MIGHVINPHNAMLFSPGVCEVVLEMSPLVWLSSFWGAMLPWTCFPRPRTLLQVVAWDME